MANDYVTQHLQDERDDYLREHDMTEEELDEFLYFEPEDDEEDLQAQKEWEALKTHQAPPISDHISKESFDHWQQQQESKREDDYNLTH